MEKNICIIIPTFNRLAYLRTLLEQIRLQEPLESFRVSVLVVIDGSTDETETMLRRDFSEVHILAGTGGWWWTKSVNEGVRYALPMLKPDYLLLLNDDSQIQPDYLRALVKASAEAGPDAIIGSISVTDKEPFRVSFSGVRKIDWVFLKKYNYHKSFELLGNLPAAGLFPTYALNGRGTLVSSAVLQQMDLLDEHAFPQYGSDDDLALRAWKGGNKVMIAYSCRVFDRTGDTSKGSALRQDGFLVFFKSFFTWNSVNYIPKQWRFFSRHGKTVLLPYYLLKFLAGTTYAWLFKYKRMKHEL